MSLFRENRRLLLCLIATVCSIVFSACEDAKQPNYQYDVEIAPGQWLTLKEERGKSWLITEWKGKQVVWEGKRDRFDELEIPVTLREHGGDLYLIVFNRENMDALRFVYFKLDESGERFVKIPSREFPKRIATQNMDLSSRTRFSQGLHGRIDEWELIRKLDVNNRYFLNTYTAKIWTELETGLSYGEHGKIDQDERERIVRVFKTKYQPISLPTLVREQ